MFVGFEAVGHRRELRVRDDLVPHGQIESGAVVLDGSASGCFEE